MAYESIKNKAMALLNGEVSDTFNLEADIFIEKALSFCNRADVPLNMEPILIKLVVENDKEIRQDLESPVKSIQRGDTKIEYETNREIKAVERMKRDLLPYRIARTY